ncbi:nucleotidyltransferase [Pyrococcus kukulkanii]|uniref:nucleotidyltransferase n=1 Tax=Pyrococcus kukulkanii TaxID=1609559 RepID=UPI0035660F31
MKEEIVKRILEVYGDNVLSIVFYGGHLKGLIDEIDVLVILREHEDPVKVNRLAEFITKVKDPVERELGIKLAFELYTLEEIENFHASLLDILKCHEVAYDPEGYFRRLAEEVRDPYKNLKRMKYLTTIEVVRG